MEERMNWILMNVLITAILVGALAAITNYVIKPALRKKFFNTPGVVEQIHVDDQTSVLMLTKPFPWFALGRDFLNYAITRQESDPTIDVLCYVSGRWKDPTTILASFTSANNDCKYNFQKLGFERCRIAFEDTAIVKGSLSKEDIKELVLLARR